ncbi:MAG: hypothetical protein ABR975_04090 [Vulcanimicrobiaceae bacterium]
MRQGVRSLAWFGVLALGGLAACSGGGGGSSVAPSAPAPTPSFNSVGFTGVGTTATYTMTQDEQVTIPGNGVGGPQSGATPQPSPTTIVLASFTQTTSVTAGATYAGRSGLADVHTVTTLSGANSSYSSYQTTQDAYEQLASENGVLALQLVGTVENDDIVQTGSNQTDADTSSTTTVWPMPELLQAFPAENATLSPDMTLQLQESDVETTYGATATITESETQTWLRGGMTIAASASGTDGYSAQLSEMVQPAGLATTYTTSGVEPSPPPELISPLPTGGPYAQSISVGAPIAVAGSYVIPYAAANGTALPLPLPSPTNVPLWYPAGPTQNARSITVTDHGVKPVPAQCALGAGLPASAEAIETVDTQVDPISGNVIVEDTTRYDASIGMLCAVDVETQNGYDPATGQLELVATTTTMQALQSTTATAGTSSVARHAAGVAAGIAFLPPAPHVRAPFSMRTLRAHRFAHTR